VRTLAKTALVFAALTGFAGPGSAQDEDIQVDWVQAYESNRAEHSFDYLLNCCAKQWPNEVKAANGPAAATAGEIEAAIRTTRTRCRLELQVRLDQINVDLARRGMHPPEIEVAAQLQLEGELDDMFAEYWSRL